MNTYFLLITGGKNNNVDDKTMKARKERKRGERKKRKDREMGNNQVKIVPT